MAVGVRHGLLGRAAVLAGGLAACALLAYNTAVWRADTDFSEMGALRRLWSDQALAITAFLDARYPASPEERAAWPGRAIQAYRRVLTDKVRIRELRPSQFWRTIPDRPFRADRRNLEPQGYDDPGRARVMGWGFRLLGGIAPFLILWVAPLVAFPVIVWLVAEIADGGHPVASVVFGVGLGASAYVAETLSLARYAVGFYLVGVLVLVAFAAHATLASAPTLRGLLARAAGAGLFLGVVILSRSAALTLLPAFLAALAIGLARARQGAPQTRRGLLAAALAAVVLLLGPYFLVRPPALHHEIWSTLWQGLGDFDRVHGHVWADEAANAAIRAAGGRPLRPGESLVAYDATPESQAILRRLVIDDIRQDPGWFAGILASRLSSTVLLERLWPWSPRDGQWMLLDSSVNEGHMQKYWSYAGTLDWFGLGEWYGEIPISLLLGPSLAFFAVAILGFVRRRDAALRPRLKGPLLLLGCLALGTLPLPVLITTASGQEPQAFGLVHYLAWAFLAEILVSSLRRGRVLAGSAQAAAGRP